MDEKKGYAFMQARVYLAKAALANIGLACQGLEALDCRLRADERGEARRTQADRPKNPANPQS